MKLIILILYLKPSKQLEPIIDDTNDDEMDVDMPDLEEIPDVETQMDIETKKQEILIFLFPNGNTNYIQNSKIRYPI